ncbi:tetratricopeptide repeat protein [Micromonospora palythoicola]|uniref:tetratricopeptide repeat protein n=1 Tax=Micromonospora palythoicola TaxID=3120507 RepID=UPI002FCE1248
MLLLSILASMPYSNRMAANGDGYSIDPVSLENLKPLGFDPQNTAPETRARFRYQDECVAVAVLNHLPNDGLAGILVEYSTDVILVPSCGSPELVSIKHREPNQLAESSWSWSALRKQDVLRHLHLAWMASSKTCSVAFWSNGGFTGTTYALWKTCALREPLTPEVVRQISSHLKVDAAEAEAFARALTIPRQPLPRRKEISAVGISKAQRILQRHGDPTGSEAWESYEALVALIAEAGTDSPIDEIGLGATLHAAAQGDAVIRMRSSWLSRERLMQALLEPLRDVNRLGPTTTAYPYSWEPDPGFVGRESYLDEVAELLGMELADPVAPVVVHGVPGCGKTSFALQFAALRSDAFRPVIVNGSTKASLVRDLWALNPQGDLPEVAGLSSLGASVTPSLPYDDRTILIIDGVTDASVIRGVIPRRAACRVLITSTVPFLDLGYRHIELPTWSRRETLSFLRAGIPDAGDDELDGVASALHDHPLAVVQATSYCRSTKTSPSVFLERLAQEPLRILNKGDASGHPESVVKTVQLSFSALSDRVPVAGDLLSVLSYYGADPIDLSLLRSDWPIAYLRSEVSFPRRLEKIKRSVLKKLRPDLVRGVSRRGWEILQNLHKESLRQDSIDALVHTSLMQRRGDALVLHPLIAMIVRNMNSDPVPLLEVGIGLVSANLPTTAEDDPKCDPYVGHIAALTAHGLSAGCDGLAIVKACSFLSRRLPLLGSAAGPHSAVTFAAQGVELISARVDRGRMPLIALVVQRQAASHAYFWSGEIDQAIELLSANLDAGRTLKHGEIMADAICDLGIISAETGRRDLAARILSDLPPEGLFRGDQAARVELVRIELLRMLGRGVEASKRLDRFLAEPSSDLSLSLRADSYRLASLLARDVNDMERSYYFDKKYHEAQRLRSGTRSDIPLIYSYLSLADGAIDVDNLKEAANQLKEAERLIDADFGQNSEVRYEYNLKLGRLLFHQGRYREAVQLLGPTIEALEKLPRAKLSLPAALLHYGQARLALRQSGRALSAIRKAYEIDLSIFGPEHPETLKDLEVLQGLEEFLKRWKQ